MKFSGKTALVTCASRYMGPPISQRLESEGATVIRSDEALRSQSSIDELLKQCGELDIVIANFAAGPFRASVDSITDADWQNLYDELVTPLMKLVRGVSGSMKNRGHGKIVAVTSAAPLRGIPEHSAYCAARGAQNAFVRAAGLELARHNVQFNAIGQNYVENNAYYPPEALADERMQKHVRLNVPTGKIAAAEETAELACYLASDNCTHLVGQVIPFAGGWSTST